MLQLRLLGGFEARLPSGQTVEISGKKTQALMAFLALNAGKKLPREKLADLLWSDRGNTQARSSLRQALGTLRRDLDGIDPEPLIIDADSLGGDASALSIDVVEFERLAASAKVDDLRRAAALYAGDLVDGLVIRDPAFEEWLSFDRTRLRDMAGLGAGQAVGTARRRRTHRGGQAFGRSRSRARGFAPHAHAGLCCPWSRRSGHPPVQHLSGYAEARTSGRTQHGDRAPSPADRGGQASEPERCGSHGLDGRGNGAAHPIRRIAFVRDSHRCPAFWQHDRRPGAGLLQRRHHGGHHH